LILIGTTLLFTLVAISLHLMHETMAAMVGATLLLAITYVFGMRWPDWYIIEFERAIHHTVGIADRAGYPVLFKDFAKVGVPTTSRSSHLSLWPYSKPLAFRCWWSDHAHKQASWSCRGRRHGA